MLLAQKEDKAFDTIATFQLLHEAEVAAIADIGMLGVILLFDATN